MDNKNWTAIKRTSLRKFFSDEKSMPDVKITDELAYYAFICGYAIRKVDNHWIVPSHQYTDVIEVIKWKIIYDIEWESRKKRKTRKLLMFGL